MPCFNQGLGTAVHSAALGRDLVDVVYGMEPGPKANGRTWCVSKRGHPCNTSKHAKITQRVSITSQPESKQWRRTWNWHLKLSVFLWVCPSKESPHQGKVQTKNWGGPFFVFFGFWGARQEENLQFKTVCIERHNQWQAARMEQSTLGTSETQGTRHGVEENESQCPYIWFYIYDEPNFHF